MQPQPATARTNGAVNSTGVDGDCVRIGPLIEWGPISVNQGSTDAEARPKRQIVWIQYLRGIAALMVVFHHSLGVGPGLPLHQHGLEFGASGVALFFVLSGFVIFFSQGTKSDIRTYTFHRIARVVPLYWFYLTGFAALCFASGSYGELHPKQSLLSFLFVPHYSTLHPDKIWPILVPGWSLNYEMFFYALFGLSMLARSHRALIISTTILALVALGVALPMRNAIWTTYTNPYLLLFLAGILLAVWTKARGLPLSLAALLPIGLVGLVLSDLCDFPPVIEWGIPSVAMVIGALALEGRMQLPFLKHLGDMSYSLYLSHTLTMMVVRKVWNVLHPSIPFAEPIFVITLVGASIAAGSISYRMLEVPLLARLKRRQVAAGQDQPLALSA